MLEIVDGFFPSDSAPDCSQDRRPGSAGVQASETRQTVAARFAKQAALHADRVAIRTRTETWTYAELNRRADRVARALTARGAGAEPVAVLMDKTAWVYAALLGVLKAGNFYVPLSPQYPRARNALLVEDSGARVLVADGRNSAEATALVGPAGMVNCDDLDPRFDAVGPGATAGPDDPVYILYTSGTTGRPKGVIDSHRNLLNNIRNYTIEYGLGPDDRLLCLGSHVYSGSLKDIYGALLNGATLYPVDIQTEGLAGLADWIAAERVTVYDSVPTVYRHFLATLTGVEDLSAVRVVRLGGEAVTARDVELFRRHFTPPCVLVNGYGATETGTACTVAIGHHTPLPAGPVPIGRPPQGVDVLVVDDSGGEVRAGGVGQLAVCGDYLALGYWKRLDLTDRAFRTDLPAARGRRVYLTGDLGVPGGGRDAVRGGPPRLPGEGAGAPSRVGRG